MICLPLPFFPWIQRKCVASSWLDAVSGRMRASATKNNLERFAEYSINNDERQGTESLECWKLFPPKFSAVKFSAAPTARLTGEGKGGVLSAAPRAAGGADTSQSESRGWGVMSTLTYAFLSVCTRNVASILYAHTGRVANKNHKNNPWGFQKNRGNSKN